MSEKQVDLFDSNFKLSHLTSKSTSHQIRTLKPQDKNVELRVIVISKRDNFVTTKQVSFSSFVVADATGSIIANFYTNNGSLLLTQATPSRPATSSTSTTPTPRSTKASSSSTKVAADPPRQGRRHLQDRRVLLPLHRRAEHQHAGLERVSRAELTPLLRLIVL